MAVVRDSVDFGPTLVVWFVDTSPSAMRWGSEIRSLIRRFYIDEVPQLQAGQPDRLESAVWSISKSVGTPCPRTSDPAEVVSAIDGLRVEGSGREATFAVIEQALEKYLSARTEQYREVLFVVVTDEAGDDWQKVDQLTALPRKYAIPIYAIGVPAPLGRYTAIDSDIESGGIDADDTQESDPGAWRPIRQGPETRALERINLSFYGYEEDLYLLDSGFGPFGLERLCRASGGAFLAVRSREARDFAFRRSDSWPRPGMSAPDPAVMRRYLPEPLNNDVYQAQLESNRARMALHQAAQAPRAEVLRDPQLQFVKRNEADLKNMLDKAQQAAAKVAPAVDELYELLRDGSVDAVQLTQPRWRASYSLAFGRVCAAKARIDGYNSMLAALKRGKTFENESSTTWVLQYADSCDTSSSLEKLIERAKMLLQEVVEQHPGTPWARIAQQELDAPMGWEWAER